MRTWRTRNDCRVTEVLHGRCNCFLVRHGDASLLVDTGRSRSWRRLRAGLVAAGVAPGRPLDVVLTHTHFDHAENVASVRDTWDATLFVHDAEADCVARGRGPVPMGTVPLTRALMRAAGHRADGWFRYRPAVADVQVGTSLELSDRGLPVRLIHTPGHTAGSISVIVDDEVALVGDAMVGVVPWAVFPPFGEDAVAIVASWRILLDTGCRVFLPAHGGPCAPDTVLADMRRRLR